jgi:hypothetical protein
MPMDVLATRMRPKSPSLSGPTTMITRSSTPRMALKRVKMLARRMLLRLRLGRSGTSFVWPASIR